MFKSDGRHLQLSLNAHDATSEKKNKCKRHVVRETTQTLMIVQYGPTVFTCDTRFAKEYILEEINPEIDASSIICFIVARTGLNSQAR